MNKSRFGIEFDDEHFKKLNDAAQLTDDEISLYKNDAEKVSSSIYTEKSASEQGSATGSSGIIIDGGSGSSSGGSMGGGEMSDGGVYKWQGGRNTNLEKIMELYHRLLHSKEIDPD